MEFVTDMFVIELLKYFSHNQHEKKTIKVTDLILNNVFIVGLCHLLTIVFAGRTAKAERRRGQGRSTKRISQPVFARIEEAPRSWTWTARNRDRQRWVFVRTRRRRRWQQQRHRRRAARTIRADIQGYWWVLECITFVLLILYGAVEKKLNVSDCERRR